jgi:predicted TIM-barrel fold metal-dependent hydrolase
MAGVNEVTLSPLFICDSQVHAPDGPTKTRTHGIAEEQLLLEMAAAGVQRAVIIPLTGVGSVVDHQPSLQMAERQPHRFAVMGVPNVAERHIGEQQLRSWRSEPNIRGIRISFVRDPNRSLLISRKLDWLWNLAGEQHLPIMVNAPDLLAEVGLVAQRFGGLRVIVDHMGLAPYVKYTDLGDVTQSIIALAGHPNIAIKLSSLPSSVDEAYPCRSLHAPLKRVIGAFGANRTFWGSDLTRLPCSYYQCVTMFTEELAFLSPEEKEWIMGRGICSWLAWPY